MTALARNLREQAELTAVPERERDYMWWILFNELFAEECEIRQEGQCASSK